MIDNLALSADAPSTEGAPSRPVRRPRPERETMELEAMLARMLRAMTRRAQAGDLEALAALVRLGTLLELATHQAAVGLHECGQPYSWTEIARELGITRQAARQRFGQ